MQVPKVQARTKILPPPRCIQDIISSQVNSLCASDARNKYVLYTRIIKSTIFNRSISDINDTIPLYLFPYLELRNILIFKIVSKRLYNLSSIINSIDVHVKSERIIALTRITKETINKIPLASYNSSSESIIPLTRITKEDINKLPLTSYNGPLKVISSPGDIEKAVKKLSKENLLGFDTETRPAFKKGESYLPSLIQLAGEKKVYIFQLHSTKIEPFKALFANINIKKVGVGINDDIRQLRKLGPFEPAGFVEISRLPNCNTILNKGLQALAAFSLGVQISKKKKLQLSNWSNQNLTQAQINYAATDAWISREIYKKFTTEDL